jgi:hypothetical protein
MSYAPFSPCELWWFGELYELGLSVSRIARDSGRYQNSVRQALIRMGRHKAMSRAYIKPDSGGQPMMRRCLCCGDDFLSEGKHNRLCMVCKGRETGPLEQSLYSTGRHIGGRGVGGG